MPYTYLLALPQPPTTSLDPFKRYASSITTIFMNFFHRCFINFSKLKHKCENVSPLITCSITPINHHGIFSIVNHFSRSHILIMLLALQQYLPGLFSMETFFSHYASSIYKKQEQSIWTSCFMSLHCTALAFFAQTTCCNQNSVQFYVLPSDCRPLTYQ